MLKLTKGNMESIKWFLSASVDDIIIRSVENNWDSNSTNMWINIKIAQNLERIKGD